MTSKAARSRKRKKDGPRPDPASPSPDPGRTRATTSALDLRWSAVWLFAAVLLAYLPALGGDFLWDDDAHVTRPDLRSLAGLARIWTDIGATQQYYPLLHSAFWFEHRLWGNAAVGYHLVNVLLHAGSACLLLLILRRLAVPGAHLAAAVFALHPVHVESVAWISEQKNTLSLLLYLGAMLCYLHFDERRRLSLYFLACGLFALGLLAKTVVATLAGALLVIAWWRRGRLSWRRDVVPLVPWFVLGAAAGLLTAWFERRLLGAEGADFHLTLLQRVLLAGRVVWFYLGKLFWPVELTFIYPRWKIDASAWPQWLPLLGVLALVVASWLVRRYTRVPLAVALFFLGSLFPVLGFLDVYPFVFSFVADHFLYLPSLGIITAAAAAFALWVDRGGVRGQRLGRLCAVAVVATLGVLTWRQSEIYGGAKTLYEATLARNPGCYLCLNNLGTLAIEAGRPDEALERYRQALLIKPDSAEAHGNLANILVQSGAVPEGIEQYELALEAAPNNVITRTNLGIALFSAGRLDEAGEQFEAALRVMPDYAPARQNLSVVRATQRARASRD